MAVEISRKVSKVYEQAAISLRLVETLLARCGAGEKSLEDLPNNDRALSDENISLIIQLLADDPYLSQKTIATILSMSPTTMKRILFEELSLRKVNFKRIPHRLSDEQKRERVRLSMKLLQSLEARRPHQIANISTGAKHGFALTIRALQYGWTWMWTGRLVCDHQLKRKNDDLGLFLAVWKWECHCLTRKRNIYVPLLCQ
jgi:hypothetical protein